MNRYITAFFRLKETPQTFYAIYASSAEMKNPLRRNYFRHFLSFYHEIK